MPFNNAGGSIRSGLVVLIVGWFCHRCAKAWSSQRARSEKQPSSILGALGKPTGRLNVAELEFLVRCPHASYHVGSMLFTGIRVIQVHAHADIPQTFSICDH